MLTCGRTCSEDEMNWYKFDFAAYWAETYGIADAEDLAYRRLRDLYYQAEGPIENDPSRIEREIALDWDCIEPVLLRFFVQEPKNYWTHKAWQEDIDHRKKRSASNAKAGQIGGKAKKVRKAPEML